MMYRQIKFYGLLILVMAAFSSLACSPMIFRQGEDELSTTPSVVSPARQPTWKVKEQPIKKQARVAFLLPTKFFVYSNDRVVSNYPCRGLTKRVLPNVNSYQAAGGCYIACYSRLLKGASYSVGGGINVMGQIRVPGRYIGRVCHPTSWEYRDISAAAAFKKLCRRTISSCENGGCWAGGDTGGWFAIQR